jgi:hypothetical protein
MSVILRIYFPLVLSVTLACVTEAIANDSLIRATAPARPSAMWTPEGKPERLEFNFGDITAWIRNKGGWHIAGRVPHSGLLCGTYELGMRFGVGAPGCTDVKWLTEVEYGTRVRQCNSAAQHHDGGGFQPDLAEEFGRITCGERVIRCTGNCK